MSDEHEAVMVRITGRVQGVGFRAWTLQEAQRLGLTGWVRNDPDRSVVALIVGPSTAVAAMLERLWRGPALASVSDVEPQPANLTEKPLDFRITR